MAATRADTGGLGLERGETRAMAERAGLVYVSRESPGISRRRRGRGFSYHADGRTIRDDQTRARIKALAIPPAWEDVWICRDDRGHLQACGRDAAGRMQYRYHDEWTRIRSEAKFERLVRFGAALPKLRRRVDRDLGGDELDRERVVAAAVRLLDLTLMRPGHEEYTQASGSRGLTTLRADDVSLGRGTVRFHYVGKSNQERELEADDPRVAEVLRGCRRRAEGRLLRFCTDDRTRCVDADDLNAYIEDATGHGLTAKHFRAWGGTVLAAGALATLKRAERATKRRKQVVRVVKEVAERLGNTPATARKHYIHPGVIGAFEEGSLRAHMGPGRRTDRVAPRQALSAREKRVLQLLGGDP